MTRQTDLAKIHIARKALGIDDDTYRIIVKDIGGAESGSSKDLTATGRAKLIGHFKRLGWKAKKPTSKQRSKNTKSPEFATDGQIQFLQIGWDNMHKAGLARIPGEAGLRKWIKACTRRYHPEKTGYDAPEFLPRQIAIQVIEHMKQWAHRANVDLS